MYTLKQACQILNLTEHTIRYYTDIGIVEVKRDKNNHRLFDEQAIQERLDILIKQKEKAEEELEAAKQRLQFLNHKIEKEKRILNHLIDDNQNPSKKIYTKD